MKIADLKFDAKNANLGTDRGRKALAESLKQFGAGRSILVDKKGRVIAGNKTLEQAIAAGHKNVTVVKTDGSQLVAVQRTDLDLKDSKARALAVADNRVGELDLAWDPNVLEELAKDVDLTAWFSEKELGSILGTEALPAPEEKKLNHGFGVIVSDITETQQISLLKRLSREGLTCRALTF